MQPNFYSKGRRLPKANSHQSSVKRPNFLDGRAGLPYAPRRDTSPQREAYYLEG